MAQGTTCRCGSTWTGMRIEHCTVCHQTFTSTSAGDKHRVGDHNLSVGPDRRRCLTEEEMTAKGMRRNARKIWTIGGGDGTKWWENDTTDDDTEPAETVAVAS